MNLLAVIFGALFSASGIWGLVAGRSAMSATGMALNSIGVIGSLMILAGGFTMPSLIAYGLIAWGLSDIVTGIIDLVSPSTLMSSSASKTTQGLASAVGKLGGPLMIILGIVWLYLGYTMIPPAVPTMMGGRRWRR